MKSIHINMDDSDYNLLKAAKENLANGIGLKISWITFMKQLVKTSSLCK